MLTMLAGFQGSRPLCACSTKQMAYVATLRSDLFTIADAEAAWFARHGSYTADPEALSFRPSTGVTVTFDRADSLGWRARASHAGIAETCIGGTGAGAPTEPTARERGAARMYCEPLDDPFGMRPIRIVTGAGVLSILIALALVRRIGARPGMRAPPVRALALLAVINPFWLLLLRRGTPSDCGFTAAALSLLLSAAAWVVTAIYFVRRKATAAV